jgi:protein-disulfide isomerase-like protein with CxxC motif
MELNLLIAGIGFLFTTLSGLAAAAFRFLLDESKAERAERVAEKAAYEAKLDVSATVIVRQNESMQKQIDAQTLLVGQQQQMIAALQSLAKGPPA